MKIFYSILLVIATFSVSAANIYVSKDANGNMVFSDKPSSTSERLEVKELPSVPAYTVSTKDDVNDSSKENTKQAFTYNSLAIVSPSNDYTLEVGYAGKIDITGTISPGLQDTDSIFLLDNGQVIRKGKQSSFSLTNLDRGAHTFQLVVRDQKGKTLISSNSVTVHVKRASVLHRQ